MRALFSIGMLFALIIAFAAILVIAWFSAPFLVLGYLAIVAVLGLTILRR